MAPTAYDDSDQVRLFTSLPIDHPLHVAVRDGLRRLQSETSDPGLARAVREVLRGRRTIPDLTHQPAFAALMADAAERSRAETAALTREQIDSLRTSARTRTPHE